METKLNFMLRSVGYLYISMKQALLLDTDCTYWIANIRFTVGQVSSSTETQSGGGKICNKTNERFAQLALVCSLVCFMTNIELETRPHRRIIGDTAMLCGLLSALF